MSGPGRLLARPCRRCEKPIGWARTAATESGRGGKAMPLDPTPDPKGNVAVSEPRRGLLVARVLHKGESHVNGVEDLYVPHFATCDPGPLPENVVKLDDRRKSRRPRADARPF